MENNQKPHISYALGGGWTLFRRDALRYLTLEIIALEYMLINMDNGMDAERALSAGRAAAIQFLDPLWKEQDAKEIQSVKEMLDE